jgi:hypothetical protein
MKFNWVGLSTDYFAAHTIILDFRSFKEWRIQPRSAILVIMRPLATYQQKRPNGCFVIKRFAGAVVEFFYHLVNVLIRYVLKTTALGKVLPDQAIGVFVQATFP